MYIKKVIIKGLLTYERETVVKLDPGYNVLVGNCGSGKTNFLRALMLVINHDEWSRLRAREQAAERRRVLYNPDTPGSIVIVLYDPDGGIIIRGKGRVRAREEREVTVKRAISSEADEFFLNGKKIPRDDVTCMLRFAGIPPVPAYMYIKQDMVDNMVMGAGSRVLQLLQKYTADRSDIAESDIFSFDGETILEKTVPILSEVEELLGRYRDVSVKVEQRQILVRRQRTLEYVIAFNQHNDEKKQLQDVGDAMKLLNRALIESRVKIHKERASLQTAKRVFKETMWDCDVGTTVEDREDPGRKLTSSILRRKLISLVHDRALLITELEKLKKDVTVGKKLKEGYSLKLDGLDESIRRAEHAFKEADSVFEDCRRQEYECARELARRQKRKNLLDFTSKEERDRWITAELKSIDEETQATQDKDSKVTENMQKYAEAVKEATAEIGGILEEIVVHQGKIIDISKELYECKKKLAEHWWKTDKLAEKNDELWRRVTFLKEDQGKANLKLASIVGKDVVEGLESVQKVLEQFKSKGESRGDLVKSYHGTVIDMYDCDWEYDRAAEVTAGNRLLDHVVDSDKIGDKINREIQRQNLPGKVSFISLESLTSAPAVEISPVEPDVVPLLSHLTFDRKGEKVLRDVFGKTLICPTTSCASREAAASESRPKCVTLEGRQVSADGIVSVADRVGCISCREIWRDLMDLKAEIGKLNEERQRVGEELSTEKQEIADRVSEKRRLMREQDDALSLWDCLKSAYLSKIEKARSILKAIVASLEVESLDYNLAIAVMQTTKEDLETELLEELVADLSLEDQHEFECPGSDIIELEQRKAQSNRCRVTREEKNKALKDLVRQRDEVLGECVGCFVEQKEELLRQKESDLAAVAAKIDETEEALKMAEEMFPFARNELDTLRQKEEDLQKEFKKMEKIAHDLSVQAEVCYCLRDKVEKEANWMRALEANADCGLLQEYSSWGPQRIRKEFKKIDHEIKELNLPLVVAPIYLENYLQGKSKMERKKEEQESICSGYQDCTRAARQEWNESFALLFTKVNEHFCEIFREFVPQGRAQLILKYADGSERDTAAELYYRCFVGVSIRVLIDRNDEERELGELSRSQRILLSVALIFALHKVFPSPFLLLDEIDEVLSMENSLALAFLITEQRGQIIAVTYKAEMAVETANFLRFRLEDWTTYVESIRRDMALQRYT